MQSTVEEAGRHTVTLTVEVSPEEVARDLARVYRQVATQVKVPGFRKGKVPRQIIDAQIGREAVLEEFVHENIPSYFRQAVREHELAPISDPEISVDTDDVDERRSLVFTATVEIRPRLTLEDYRGVTVPRPSVEVTERDVDEFVDRLRDRFAELEWVSHPVRRGDYVVADVRATVHGQEVEGVGFTDQLYEVGSEALVRELDKELEGTRKGEILKFNEKLPERFGDRAGEEVSFQVLVKEVKAKKLPAADDEFAKMASEFDTLEELRADLREKIGQAKEAEARAEFRESVLQELISRVDVDLPDRLVDAETEDRVRRAKERAERAGLTLDDLLESQGWDELRFRSDARDHAIRAVKADLVLEAVARQEGLTVTTEELNAAVADLARALGRDPKEIGKTLERTGQVAGLAGDIIRSKALDLLVESAKGIPEDGSPREDQGSTDPKPTSNQGASE